MTAKSPEKPPDRSGNRTVTVIIDLSDEEEAIIASSASRKRLTTEEYLRTCIGLPP